MSNFTTPWFIEGALHSAQVARNLVYAATGGKQGLVTSADCQVLELATPGGSVRVVPGTVVATAQGLADESYLARLPVEDTVAITPTDSTAARSDLIVVRVVNPAYETAPADWPAIDPSNGPFVQTYVYEGVPAGTTDVQAVDPGVSAITLARVDLPVSTATVTQGMIVDLRPDVIGGDFLPLGGGSLTGNLVLPEGNRVEFGHPSVPDRFQVFADDRAYLNFYQDANGDGVADTAAFQITPDSLFMGLPPDAPGLTPTSNYYLSVSTTGTSWSNIAQVSATCPPSGRLLYICSAYLEAYMEAAVQAHSGAALITQQVTPEDISGVMAAGTTDNTCCSVLVLQGTPGDTVNAMLKAHHTQGGTGSLLHIQQSLIPMI